jgi:hypothetical protein
LARFASAPLMPVLENEQPGRSGHETTLVPFGPGRVLSCSSVGISPSREALGGYPHCGPNLYIGGRTQYFRFILSRNAISAGAPSFRQNAGPHPSQ